MKRLMVFFICAAISLGLLPIYACQRDEGGTNSYDIDIVYDGKNTIEGSEQFTFYNSYDNEFAQLKFNLWGNAFRQDATYSSISQSLIDAAYYGGNSYGNLQINSVENCGGWEVGGEDKNILTVTLNTPIYPQDTAVLNINFTLTLANVNARLGVAENSVNLGNFYPILCAYDGGFAEYPYYSCGDPFISDCANYSVKLTCPKEYIVASSGSLNTSSQIGDNMAYSYTLENARDFALVLSNKFSILKASVNGIDINYYYLSDENADRHLNIAEQSLEYFISTFGDYLYPTLSVVQTGFCVGGMEYPALTYISDELNCADACYTIVHENAHQWWYAAVGNDQVNDGWQDEGLAEYSTLMFFENTPEYGITKTSMLGQATKTFRAFYSVYNQLFGDADTTMNRSLNDFISDYEYTNIAYNKGLLLFEALKNSLGDKKFTSALKDYYAEYSKKIATKEALIACFAKYGDIEGIFDSFLNGKIII